MEGALVVWCRNCHTVYDSDAVPQQIDLAKPLDVSFTEGKQFNTNCVNCGHQNNVVLVKLRAIPEQRLPQFRQAYFQNRYAGCNPIEAIGKAKEKTIWSRFNLN